MAKLKGPLFSLGARGQIGKTLVYFGWKGLQVVRTWVSPTNPRTAGQTTQRGHLTAAVDLIHTTMADDTDPLNEADRMAYALLASTYPTPRTWFNQAVKDNVDQAVAGREMAIFHGAVLTPTDGQVEVDIEIEVTGAQDITAGAIWYGTSPTALVHHTPTTGTELRAGQDITGLTNGVKYYFQYRATEHADFLGARSGIYHATPAA